MKNLQIIAYSLFTTGIVLKFLHLPKNAFVILSGIILLLIINSIAAFKRQESKFTIFKGFASTLWLTLILFTLKFWPFTFVILILALVLTGITIAYGINEKKLSSTKGLAVCIVAAFSFYLMPSDMRYELISIKWNQEIKTDYRSWDKYSWFLYQNENYTAAFSASEKALSIAKEQKNTDCVTFISKHQELIKTKSWNSYR